MSVSSSAERTEFRSRPAAVVRWVLWAVLGAIVVAVAVVLLWPSQEKEAVRWAKSLDFGAARQIEDVAPDRASGAVLYIELVGDLTGDQLVDQLIVPSGYTFEPAEPAPAHTVGYPDLGPTEMTTLGELRPEPGSSERCTATISIAADDGLSAQTHVMVGAACPG